LWGTSAEPAELPVSYQKKKRQRRTRSPIKKRGKEPPDILRKKTEHSPETPRQPGNRAATEPYKHTHEKRKNGF